MIKKDSDGFYCLTEGPKPNMWAIRMRQFGECIADIIIWIVEWVSDYAAIVSLIAFACAVWAAYEKSKEFAWILGILGAVLLVYALFRDERRSTGRIY